MGKAAMFVCWSAKQPEDYEKFLSRLIDRAREGEMSYEVLTVRQFNVAIAACSSSKSKKKTTGPVQVRNPKRKPQLSLNLWNIAPDIITYNSLVTA